MSTDGDLRAIFRRNIKNAHWSSVETGVLEPGIPDSHYCLPGGIDGFIEFKVTGAWAVRVRPAQVGWILKRISVGGRVFIAVRRVKPSSKKFGHPVDQLWLFRGEAAPFLKRGGLKGVPRKMLEGLWDCGPKEWNWKDIEEVLKGEISF